MWQERTEVVLAGPRDRHLPATEQRWGLRAKRPGLLGISATTPYGSTANAVARVRKEVLPGRPVVLGEPHPTALPGGVT